jgi:hypothetical protein
MSNYTKLVNYIVKDSLPTGNPAKIIKGTELDNEFSAISSAISTKLDSAGGTLNNGILSGTTSISGTLNISATTTVTGALSSTTFSSGNVNITGGSIANTTIGFPTASSGAFTTLSANFATFSGGSANAFVIGAGTPAAGTFSVLNSPSVALTGGNINNTVIGATTANTGSFTALTGVDVTASNTLQFKRSVKDYNSFSVGPANDVTNFRSEDGTGGIVEVLRAGQTVGGVINLRNIGTSFTANADTPVNSTLGQVQGVARVAGAAQISGQLSFLTGTSLTTGGITQLTARRADTGVSIKFSLDGIANNIQADHPIIVSGAFNDQPAMRITNTGTANAFVVEDNTNPDTTPFVIDAEGRLVIGNTVARTVSNIANTNTAIIPKQVFEAQVEADSTSAFIRNSNTTGGYQLIIGKTRGAIGGITTVNNNDNIGHILAQGSDGTTLITGAHLAFQVARTPSTGVIPMRATVSTMNSSGQILEGLLVTDNQAVSLSRASLVSTSASATAGTDFTALRNTNIGSPNISTFTSAGKSITLTGFGNNHTALTFNLTGTKAFIANNTTIRELTLSTPWDISTATQTQTQTPVTPQTSGYGSGLEFNSAGTKLYVLNNTGDAVYQFSVSTPFTLTGLTYDNVLLEIGVVTANNPIALTNPSSFRFSPDGLRMFILDDNLNAVYQYNMTVAYDIVNAVQQVFTVPLGAGTWSGLSIDATGQRLFISDSGGDRIITVRLAAPYSLEFSTSVPEQFLLTTPAITNPQEIFFAPSVNGTFYVLDGISTSVIYQFNYNNFDLNVYGDTTFFGQLVVPKLTTAMRNNLIGLTDGMIIYNITTNKFNFRENGAWVAPTVTAA